MTDLINDLRSTRGHYFRLQVRAADEIERLNEAITTVLGDPDLPPLAVQTLTEALGSPKRDTED